jgi:predicted nucleic acid-binding protein
MRLLDTDVLIDIQRGHPPAVAWFTGLTELPAICGLVLMEMIQDARNMKEVQQALKLTAPFRVVWPTESDCQKALADFLSFHLSHSLGLLDALIGACAVGQGAALCTFNTKHFQVVPGLNLEQPYTR